MEYTFDALREFMHNMDWLQGLMIIAALEARASYDPYFRLSFPKILQESKWFLWVLAELPKRLVLISKLQAWTHFPMMLMYINLRKCYFQAEKDVQARTKISSV